MRVLFNILANFFEMRYTIGNRHPGIHHVLEGVFAMSIYKKHSGIYFRMDQMKFR